MFCVRLSGGEEAATTSTDFASASTEPSLLTRVMEISDLPAAPAGSVIFRLGSAAMGTAQEPGAIECPSDNAIMGGKPRILMKLPFGDGVGRSDADGQRGLRCGLGGQGGS